ncbi:DUF2461 domain-containing protein [Nonomuraea muscovyensis]|uniref:Uncharacterized protein (TIGR02453 family) n=1 Tax=Nonomuraea muscovyensis TaxID=1124761 RepID=A0A7X0F0N9_9ACTN|nr:DUF2461 domain-containing protein [Nonomuraea muscovyensis]MBB6351497.1 uncharacterized protein (TIGR02453 family) [Nonomuraea muscovyensis]MDF2705605.1 hypothetical protein [Nonomuraea muscovyensis]
MGFSGFPDEAFLFYEGLEADNSKTYFTRHKHLYEEAVRAPMLALAEELAGEFGTAHLFRPHRDVRYAKDKSPYKTHQGAFVERQPGIGLYVQIDADGIRAAGGLYSQASDQVARYRAAVDEDLTGRPLEAVVAALRSAGYAVEGDRLKTRPRGFTDDHPRIELLRHRSLYAGRRFEPEPWVHTGEVVKRVRESWRAFEPLVDWLCAHVRGSELPRR